MFKYFARLKQYVLLMRLHRPIGIFLLLWPTLWALWIASDGKPNLKILIIFILGVIIMRSAGCIINDIADRNFDGFVTRTKDRPLATKKVSVKEALLLFALLSLIAFALVLFLNRLTLLLSIPGILIAIIYPFMKRFTHLPQLVLGIAFTWGIPMAFAAQTNNLPAICWLLFLITLLWIVAYDTMYAMVDRTDDIAINIKSTAILFGSADRFIIGILQITILALFFLLAKLLILSVWFYLALSISTLLFIYQQFLLRTREPQKCLQAFLNNNWVGLIIFLGFVTTLSLS